MKRDIHALLDRVASAERDFLKAEFLAPVLRGGQVRVRIEGLVLTLRVTGSHGPGWAILRPLSMEKAEILRKPSLPQIRSYLGLFPSVRLLLLTRGEAEWLAVQAQAGDTRFRIDGAVPVHLAVGVEPFERIVARYDGARFLFQEVDRRRSPAIAAYLREALRSGISPDRLRKPTLTAEEKEAYRRVFEALEEAKRSRVEIKLGDALSRADAALQSYIEHEDAYTVSFSANGRTHRATVRKDDLTVVSAGLCLSGQDQRFDLQSLVGVIQEARSEGRFVAVGEDGHLEEDD
jgi:hypothetical protein